MDTARNARNTQVTLGTAAQAETPHRDRGPEAIRVGKKHNPRLEPENFLKQGESDAP
ncbi:hypothetical protein TRM7615_00008 [Falsiruegeria mediterranea M17]|uniref:Uncharacterized protein n=1 Tax=Falsiruegeria mediterranea M17 TaxID=1200281 RepID=A0A2R8C2B2_9RHOB|nr:hypothetical protein TRM7615_00008 [Falsiruegeria mediterranea M17]